MKKINLFFIALLLFAINLQFSFSQGLGVNSTTSVADTSAILDVSSTTKGMLVPRMTSAQRTAISLPATGLIVYQTDGTSGFYYNSGTPAAPSWVILLNGTTANVTTQGNSFNGANQLLKLDANGKIPAVDGSQLTAVPSTVTTQGNTFNGTNQLVKTDGSGKLPAIDGSQLTNLSSPTGPYQKFDMSSATTLTLTDLSVRTVVAACNGRNGSLVNSFTFIFPSASSYPAGTVIRFCVVENLTGAIPTWIQSSSSFYSAFQFNKTSINNALSLGSSLGFFAFMSDGVNTWYRVN
jgi:hypothetical protein